MNQTAFNRVFTKLTGRQQEVLLKFLQGQKDADVAKELHITQDTVRRHIANICREFGLSEPGDAGYSHRSDLVTLFVRYRPELLNTSVSHSRPKGTKVLLSYHRSSESDLTLVTELDKALRDRSYDVFPANANLRMAKDGLRRIYAALTVCDYLLLILSPLSAGSEMVMEEVGLAKRLHSRLDGKPLTIPIRMNCPFSLLNHDLRGYLREMPQIEWQNQEDTPATIQKVLELMGVSAAGEKEKSRVEDLAREQIISPYAVTPHHPPLPVAEPELPRGQVELASAFYLERPLIDSRCYEAIAKPGALIRIKAPRQMGKTSLMARILHRASALGYRTVPLSFQLADSQVFANLEQFLRWFCAIVALQLELSDRLDEYWNGIFGSKVACKSYFERYLLANAPTPLALGLDEVDVAFRYPELAADFFALLRAWHEDAKNRDIWKKLRLIVVHSTEVYVPMDINQSPFNVGLPIELPEFQPPQVQDLASRHGLALTNAEVEKLMGMLGGHPYLVRLALYHIARGEITLEKLLETAPTDSGLYSDHLRRHLWNLERHPELAIALKKVVDANSPVQLSSMQGFKLHSMGLVNLPGNYVTPRCDLYRQYFRVRLSSS